MTWVIEVVILKGVPVIAEWSANFRFFVRKIFAETILDAWVGRGVFFYLFRREFSTLYSLPCFFVARCKVTLEGVFEVSPRLTYRFSEFLTSAFISQFFAWFRGILRIVRCFWRLSRRSCINTALAFVYAFLIFPELGWPVWIVEFHYIQWWSRLMVSPRLLFHLS